MGDALELLAGPGGAELARARVAALSGPAREAEREAFLFGAVGAFTGLSEAYGADTAEVARRVREACETAVLAEALGRGAGVARSFLARLCEASERSAGALADRLGAAREAPTRQAGERLAAELASFFSWRKFGPLLLAAACVVRLAGEAPDPGARAFCAASGARLGAAAVRVLETAPGAPGCARCLPGLLKLCGVAAALATRFPPAGGPARASRAGAPGRAGGDPALFAPLSLAALCGVFAKEAFLEMVWDEGGAGGPNGAGGVGGAGSAARACPRLLDLYAVLRVPPGPGLASSPDLAFTLVYDFAFLALDCLSANLGRVARELGGGEPGPRAGGVGAGPAAEGGPGRASPAALRALPFALAAPRARTEELLARLRETPRGARAAFAPCEEALREAASALEQAADLCWARDPAFSGPVERARAAAALRRASLAGARVVVSFEPGDAGYGGEGGGDGPAGRGDPGPAPPAG